MNFYVVLVMSDVISHSTDKTFSHITFTYEGCQKRSKTLIIKASNVPDFDIHYYISFK